MRSSAHERVDLAGWGVIGVLTAGAVVVATVHGFLGLFTLRTGTMLVCLLAELNQEVAGRGVSGAGVA